MNNPALLVYRHLTNLRTPFDRHDRELLIALGEYRIGDPVKADPKETELPPVPVAEMKANGVVGVYAQFRAASADPFRKYTGWRVEHKWWVERPELASA